MPKLKQMLHVAVIYNGVGEDYLSIHAQPPIIHLDELTRFEIDIIIRALEKKHTVTLIPFTGNVLILMQTLELVNPDVVLNLFEGVYLCSKSEPFVPITLDILGIPYTGSPPKTLRQCLQKSIAKKILRERSVATPPWQVFKQNENIAISLNFPVIIKPEHEDASIGIDKHSVVSSEEEAKDIIKGIWQKYRQPALVESFIDGRELNVVVIGDVHYEHDFASPFRLRTLPISEIDFSDMPSDIPPIVTYDGKWQTDSLDYIKTPPICPAVIDKQLELAVRQIAVRTFHALGCRDYARVDFRVSKNNEPFVIDVNPNPDISLEAGFARCAKADGIAYDDLILLLVDLALERSRLEQGK